MTESCESASQDHPAAHVAVPVLSPPIGPAATSANAQQPYPRAVVVASGFAWMGSRLWWLTGLSLVVALGLAAGSLWRHGSRITIHFSDGHGLKAGDVLRYRGIAVGEVTDVALARDLGGVVCTVILDPQAGPLARRDSEFWIERPRISLSRVSGLETVVGAKYLGVRPGSPDSPVAHHFEGIASPPTMLEADFGQITIRFPEGYGLQPGDPVRYRGLVVGEVASVDLENDLTSVAVRVRLSGMARRLARQGTQFWVERPRLAMAEVRGLDTLVGGRYLAVSPGPEEADECETFTGLDAASVAEIPAGALEILLHAPQRWGIDRGVSVTYRGLRVGQVHSVGLSSDGTRIEARASIEAKYRPLVRRNSVFWSNSGIDLEYGLTTGLQFTADSLSTIAQGGIAFATPDAQGELAGSGQRFAYERRAPDAAANWNPHIGILQADQPAAGARPEPQRAVAQWSEKSFGFRRHRDRTGWVILLDDGSVLGPADVLIPTEQSLNGIVLEVAGLKIPLDGKSIERNGLLAKVPLPDPRPDPLPEGVSAWKVNRIRPVTEPEDILIIADPQSAPLPFAASSLKLKDGLWELTTPSSLNPTWHGAPAVSSRDGQLVGILVFRSKPSIVPTESWPPAP